MNIFTLKRRGGVSFRFYPKLFMVLCFALLSIGAGAQMSGTYTIGGVGADYSSIQAAFTALKSSGVNGPVTLNVNASASPFVEQVDIQKINGVSSTNTVTLNGNGAMLDARTKTTSSKRYGLRFNDCDYVTINDLHINTVGATYSWNVHFYNNPTHCTLDGCDIDGSYSSTSSSSQIAVLFSNSTTSISSSSSADYNVIKNGRISGGYYAVRMYSGAYNYNCTYNEIINNEVTNFRIYGIYFYGGRGHKAIGNDIHRDGARTSLSTMYGFYLAYGSYDFEISGNKIHDIKKPSSSSSYYFVGTYIVYTDATSSKRNYYTNNMIYNIDNSTTQYGVRTYGSNNWTYANNAIILDGPRNGATTLAFASREYTSSSGEVFVNNIVDVTRNGSSNKTAIYFGPYSGSATVKSNCVNTTGATNAYYGSWMGTPAENLADFMELNTGFGENSLHTDPLYKDASNDDYFPTDARLNGKGQAESKVVEDINGVSRAGSALDIGPYKMSVDFTVTAFTLPNANECEGYEPEVEVTIKNNSSTDYTNIPLALEVTGNANGLVEEYAPGALNAGASRQYTFTGSYFFRDAGMYEVAAFPTNDDNVVNDSQSVALTILAAPRGAVLAEGANYDGIMFRNGSKDNFDVTRAGDKVEYDISTPTSYNSTDYGSTWEIDLTGEIDGGGAVSSSMLSVTAATASTDAYIVFTPDASLTDELIRLDIGVVNKGNGCDSTITRWIFVAPTPVADFDAPNVCDGDGIAFNNTSTVSTGYITYEWDFGDATTSEATSPVHKYPNSGLFNAKLTVTSNWGYTDVITKQIEVYESPNVNFSVANACEGSDVEFINKTSVASGTLSYEWTFGDASPMEIAENPKHTYAAAGEYKVVLTAEANGCKRAISKSAFQFSQPVASFTKSGGECNEQEVVLTNTSTIASGRLGSLWDLSDGTVSTNKDVTYTFADAGVKKVKLKVISDFGCEDEVTIDVELKEAPIADFSNTQTCDLDPVEFTNESFEPTGANVDYTWDFGDPTSTDNSSNLTNPTHKYSLPGARTVKLLATADNGCVNEITKDIVIGVQPLADFDIQGFCTGDPVKLNNLTTISRGDIPVTYDWVITGSEEGSSDKVSPTVNYTTEGSYDITLTATTDDESGCKDEITKQVDIARTPVCDFNTTTTGHLDVSFMPNEDDDNYTYEWIFGDGGFSSEKNPTYEYAFNLPYNVTLTITTPEGCGCSSTVKTHTTSASSIDFAEQVNIYPNPSNGVFTIDVDAELDNDVNIVIYNALGSVVSETTTQKTTNGEYIVNIAELPQGVYTVKFTSGANYFTQRITVSY